MISKRGKVLKVLLSAKNFISLSEVQKEIKSGGEHIHRDTIAAALNEFSLIGFKIERKKYIISRPPYYCIKYKISIK